MGGSVGCSVVEEHRAYPPVHYPFKQAFINFKQADSTNQESSFIIVSTNKESSLLTLQLVQNGEHGVLPLAFLTAHSQAYNVVPTALWKISGLPLGTTPKVPTETSSTVGFVLKALLQCSCSLA